MVISKKEATRMRFKDRLKALRKEKNLTQKELSEAIFVSRSAVAKWENGLGLPSRASYEELLSFFGMSTLEFPLNESDEKNEIRKDRRIHFIKETIIWILIIALAISPLFLFIAVGNGYGFTSSMAAGKHFGDNEFVSTEHYDFYYSNSLIVTEEDGTKSPILENFCAVKKSFYGYQRINTDVFKRRVYDSDGNKCGILYSLPAKGCYYNIFRPTMTVIPGSFESDENSASAEVNISMILSVVYVDGKEVELTMHALFITESRITEFSTPDKILTVK